MGIFDFFKKVRSVASAIPTAAICQDWRSHDWVFLGVVQEWTLSSGGSAGMPGNMQRVACQCSRCPVATANIMRWDKDMKKPGENPYWYGSPIGGEDVIVTEFDPPATVRKPAEYEPLLND